MDNIEKLKEIIEDIEYEKMYSAHLKSFKGEEDMIIQAVEKQIPKQPKYWTSNRDAGNCPVCGNNICVNYKFCGECGQALKWDDTP